MGATLHESSKDFKRCRADRTCSGVVGLDFVTAGKNSIFTFEGVSGDRGFLLHEGPVCPVLYGRGLGVLMYPFWDLV
jgi:hypothetical protein